jgi:hypothetical protein
MIPLRLGGKEGSGSWEEESRRLRPHVSNLPHYAAAGVKAQAFVHVLFDKVAIMSKLTQQFQRIVGQDCRFGEAGSAGVVRQSIAKNQNRC